MSLKLWTNKKGFTLVELMVSVVLLGIVLALAYQTFAFLTGTYTRTEKKWLIERDVKQTANRITRAIDRSYAAKLTNTTPAADTLGEGDRCFYYQTDAAGNGYIYFVDYDPATKTHLAPVQVNELPVQAAFSNESAAGEKKDNLVYYTVTTESPDSDYSLETATWLANVHQSVVVAEGETSPYSTLIFNVAQDGVIDISVGNLGGAGCFIATAAYGDYDQTSVMLLRRFRDQVLLTNAPGQWFVDTYYRLSPPIADVIAVHPALRFLTRVALLPAEGAAVLVLHPVFSGIVLAGCGLLYKKGKRKVSRRRNSQ